MVIQHHVQCSVQTLGDGVVLQFLLIVQTLGAGWGLVSCRVGCSVVIQFPVWWVVLDSPLPPSFSYELRTFSILCDCIFLRLSIILFRAKLSQN